MFSITHFQEEIEELKESSSTLESRLGAKRKNVKRKKGEVQEKRALVEKKKEELKRLQEELQKIKPKIMVIITHSFLKVPKYGSMGFCLCVCPDVHVVSGVK